MKDDSILREAIRINLIQARKELGLSQMELADRSDLHRNFISLIETGTNIPSILTFYKIAKALELAPSELLKKIEDFVKLNS